MKKMIRCAADTLRNNFRSIFLFELIYRIVFFTVYIRISGKILDTILKNCGYSYLNIKNVFEILKNPATYPLLLLIIILSVLFAGYEMSVLYTGFRSAALGSNMRIGVMLIRGFARFIRIFKPRNIVFLFINSVVFYIFESYWIYRAAFLSKRFAGIMDNLSEFKAAIAVVVIIFIILLFVAARYLFCTCYYMCSPNGHTNAIEGGKSFWKGRALRFLLLYAAMTVIYLVLYNIIHSLLMVIVATLVVVFAPHSYEMAFIDVIGRYINLIIIYFGSILGAMLYSGLTVSLFTQYEEDRSDIGKIERNASYSESSWKKKTLIIVSAVILIGTIVNIIDVIRTGNLTMSDAFGRIAITSHRGASDEAPENTIPSIEKAIENLSDYVEIDIRQTKDGKIILMHDASLLRTTGVDKKVCDLNFEEINKIDAGAGYSRTFAGTKIPTFEEVLDICKGKIKINVEIKADKETGDFVADIVSLVKKYDMEEQCVFTSLSYSLLKRIKSIDLELKTGYIVPAGYGDYFNDDNIDFYSVNSSYLNESLVDLAHGYGKEIHAWTVNDRSELVRMKRIGIDNVITDNPVYAREVLYGEERTQSLVSYIKMLVKQ